MAHHRSCAGSCGGKRNSYHGSEAKQRSVVLSVDFDASSLSVTGSMLSIVCLLISLCHTWLINMYANNYTRDYLYYKQNTADIYMSKTAMFSIPCAAWNPSISSSLFEQSCWFVWSEHWRISGTTTASVFTFKHLEDWTCTLIGRRWCLPIWRWCMKEGDWAGGMEEECEKE